MLRIYTDTSVIGGCLDEEFAKDSQRLFDMARKGRIVIVISQVVIDELAEAPQGVQDLLPSLPMSALEIAPLTPQVIALRNAYLRAGIVGPRWVDDATHVAAAAVARASAIVSWNFRHIVRLDRIAGYNQVNRQYGYDDLVIVTPMEVARDTTDPDE